MQESLHIYTKMAYVSKLVSAQDILIKNFSMLESFCTVPQRCTEIASFDLTVVNIVSLWITGIDVSLLMGQLWLGEKSVNEWQAGNTALTQN